MKRTSVFTIFILFIILIYSCKSEETIDDPTTAITELWSEFILHWESENAPALSDFYTLEGQNIAPGLKINNGRAEIEEFYQLFFSTNLSSKYNHKILSLDYTEDNAIELGSFQVDWVRNDSTEWSFHGRSVTHWVKEDNSWKIKTFLFNQPPESH